MPEHSDPIIGSYKREGPTIKDPDTPHGVPATCRTHGHPPSWAASEEGGYRPHTKELYGYLATERLLETLGQVVAFTARRLIQLERERDLLEIIPGQQTHLLSFLSPSMHSINNRRSNITLCSIPARARAVYAPRENPAGHPLNCSEIRFLMGRNN